MKSKITLLTFIILSTLHVSAGTFTSNGTGDWSTPGTWIVVGDANGIPDSDDDITILTGHVVTFSTNSHCRNLTVNNGGTISSTGTVTLNVFGDYVMNGTETGGAFYSFCGTGTLVDGTGTFSVSSKWSFANDRTITSSVTAIRNSWTRIYYGSVVTNFGNITLSSLVTQNGLGTWINGTNSTTTLTNSGISVIFDASSFTNNVIWQLNGASTVGLPSVLNNTYHHLSINNSTKTAQLPASTIVLGNFAVNNGGRLQLNAGINLQVNGNFVHNPGGSGILTISNGCNVTFAGNANQTITGGGVILTFYDLVVNKTGGTATISTGTYRISNSLTVSSGSLNLGANKVTLLSNAVSTAYIAQSAGTISGTMTIQRFISARPDGYSDISSPVAAPTTFASWADDFDLIFSPYVPNVTEPSCWGYDESIWDYYAIEATTENIVPGVGYEVYFDSDGDTTTPLPATTIDVTGTPNMGDITVPVTVDNDGWNLVGNPYASFIDWTHYRTNAGIAINSQFLYFDEAIEDFAFGNPGDVLAPSQGFWIEATTAGNAVFHESNKTVSTSSTFRNFSESMLTVRVSTEMIKLTSNTYVRFNESADQYYLADHDLSFLKLPNPKAPSLSSVSAEGKKLRINELNPEESLSIPLNFQAGMNGTYHISLQNIESALAEGYVSIILEDKKTGEMIDITNVDYEFESATSDESNRFVLHFYKNTEEGIATSADVSFINSSEGVFVNFNLSEMTPAYVTAYNLAGQAITTTQLVAAEKTRFALNIPESFSGVYIIRVTVGDKIIQQFTQQYFK